jgi:hypothetical protein
MQKADPQRTPQRTWDCGLWTRAAKGGGVGVVTSPELTRRGLVSWDLCRGTCVERRASSVERRVGQKKTRPDTAAAHRHPADVVDMRLSGGQEASWRGSRRQNDVTGRAMAQA